MILIDHYLMLKNVLKKLFYSGCASIFVSTFWFLKYCPPILPSGLTAEAGPPILGLTAGAGPLFLGVTTGAGFTIVLVDEEN
jgi:hypothetical protein